MSLDMSYNQSYIQSINTLLIHMKTHKGATSLNCLCVDLVAAQLKPIRVTLFILNHITLSVLLTVQSVMTLEVRKLCRTKTEKLQQKQ